MMARHLSCCLLCLLQNANQLSWPINCHFINDQQYVDVGLLCCHTFTASSHIITANSHFIQQNPKQLSPRYRAAVRHLRSSMWILWMLWILHLISSMWMLSPFVVCLWFPSLLTATWWSSIKSDLENHRELH